MLLHVSFELIAGDLSLSLTEQLAGARLTADVPQAAVADGPVHRRTLLILLAAIDQSAVLLLRIAIGRRAAAIEHVSKDLFDLLGVRVFQRIHKYLLLARRAGIELRNHFFN